LGSEFGSEVPRQINLGRHRAKPPSDNASKDHKVKNYKVSGLERTAEVGSLYTPKYLDCR
jgi:hypothetical protein